jgi:hypothetical protein
MEPENCTMTVTTDRSDLLATPAPGAARDPLTEPPDPFNPAALRLPQNFVAATVVKKLLTTVPVRKPSKESFVRTHPSEDYRIHTAVLELKDDHEIYLVQPDLLPQLAGESTVSPRLLVTTITRQGALFLWPLRLPGPDGRLDNWSRSALTAAEQARDRWVRLSANIAAGYHDVFVGSESLAPPEWPETTFHELLKLAFQDRLITDLDHPVLKKLRGEL